MGLVGEAIKGRRAEQGLSRAALAGQMGVSESQLAALEAERDLPTVPTLKRVAVFFGFTAEQVGAYVLQAKGAVCGPKPKKPRKTAKSAVK
jgi:transcriptional regulator with XRE-family HTH domain